MNVYLFVSFKYFLCVLTVPAKVNLYLILVALWIIMFFFAFYLSQIMEIIDASNRRKRVKLIYRCHLKNKMERER